MEYYEAHKPTLHQQAEAKLARERAMKDELAAWELELSQPNYYDWFLEQVREKEDA